MGGRSRCSHHFARITTMNRGLLLLALFIGLLALDAGCDDSKSSTNSHGDDTFRPALDTVDDTTVTPADTSGDQTEADLPSDLTDTASDLLTDTAADTSVNTDATDLPDVEGCVEEALAYTGVHTLDLNGDPLEIDDRVLVTVEVMADPSVTGDATLEILTTNLRTHASTIKRDGVLVTNAVVIEPRISIPISPLAPTTITFEGSPTTLTQLVTAFAHLVRPNGCTVRRSRSGSMLQVVGGTTKTALCVDMVDVRSVQVAPEIALQNTDSYRTRNGLRDDLEARNFIFCPQNPTIVHTTDFCLSTAPGQSISLAGSYAADASWEVDDFILFEAYDTSGKRDGFTSQSHPGGSSFWCADVGALMCETGCTAELTVLDEARNVPAIAVASAVGATPRQHLDGAVTLDEVIGTTGFEGTIAVTALDQGVEGNLAPALYLLSSDL
ncbi:MAG: hypothetical protein AUK47_05175 [Deltaproteobacteria bacterium CG2_30_63_29]|nr:MAG: hypothetical protein AUK47_05175 [Deltaproteobacteria bacterium CG2_30_63_29]